jgi:hypothetical protein
MDGHLTKDRFTDTGIIDSWVRHQRGRSSYGRALASHARGTGFDSPRLQFFLCFAFAHKVIILVPLFFSLYTGGKLSMATQHEFRITSFLSL